MIRKTFLLAAGIPLTMIPLGFAQGANVQRSPEPPPGVLGPQLIVWSEVQKPQPIGQIVVAPHQTRVEPEQDSNNIPEFTRQQPATDSVNPAKLSVSMEKNYPE
jgi:hypothetical protein